MTRYIDADALKAVFEEKSSEAVCGVELCKAIISRIDEAPTIDAVPVIRCKDCKYWEYYDEGDFGITYGGCRSPQWFHTTSNGLETTGDDCCSWAERKEECGQRSAD